MIVPDWIWLTFTFVFGCCVGSFLNVVIYRMPRDKSLVAPPSSCPECGKYIRFYDNIPLLSWLMLGTKCRYCKAKISPRYFIIELITGLTFTVLFILYFRTDLRAGIGTFWPHGWSIYFLHLILLASFIAASAIDLELWVIPLPICWFVTIAGLIGAALGTHIIEPSLIRGYALLPSASVGTAALALGATIGLLISWLLITTGLIKTSYESDESDDSTEQSESSDEQPRFNHRLEMYKEILFVLPVIICSLAAFWITRNIPIIRLHRRLGHSHIRYAGIWKRSYGTR